MLRSFILIFAIAFGAVLSPGCIYVDDDGGDHPISHAPTLYSPYVGCDWDPYYADSFWYFEVGASDVDGDLAMVGVDIYDRGGRYLESWELAPTGGGFAVTVYEYYSSYLNCTYGGDFEFTFWAQDYQGNLSQIPGYGGSTPSYAPTVRSPYVECGWDSYYGDYYWYFDADIRDPQGMGDITEAVVWIYWAGDSQPAEAYDLFYDSSIGRWYSTVYEYYSGVLDCRYPGSYGFQFTATDRQGNLSYANSPSVYVR